MKLFDASVRLGGDADWKRLLRELDRHQIERALVSTRLAESPHPRLVPCPILSPNQDLPEACCALRAFPERDQWTLPSSLLTELESRTIPLFVDMGQLTPSDLEALLKAHPRLPVVLTRVSYRAVSWLFPLLTRCPKLHLELSWFFYYAGIQHLVGEFGATRWLFGSTLPERDPGAAIGMLRYAQISAEERAAIAHRNLEGLLR